MMHITTSKGIVSEAWKASSGGIIAVIAFGAFINLLKFAMPMYTLQILDRIPDSRSVDSLLMLTLIALLAVLSGVSLEAIRRRMLIAWSGWVKRQFGPQLVRAGIGGTSRKQASATRSLDSLQAIRNFIEKAAASILDVVWVPAFVVVVFHIHPLFGGIMLLAMGLRLFSGYVQNHVTRPSRQQWSIASREARVLVEGAERHAESVAARSMAHRVAQRWLNSINTKLAERETSQNHGSLFSAINTGLYRSLYIAGMGFGVWLVVQGNLTLGGVIAVNIIMRFGFRILDQGVRRWESLVKARRAYKRLLKQFDAVAKSPEESLQVADLEQPLLVEGVSHRYPGQQASVLRRVNLSVARGEMLCVIGRSASGKSTFSRLMAGLLKPRRGQVRLGNMELSAIPSQHRHRVVGHLSEEARLFAGSIGENIAALQTGSETEIIDAARLAGIHDRILQLPDGYATQIDDQSPLLSAGERRRLLLARAYHGRPRLIVLDEPAAHLDRPGRDQLIEAINELKSSGSSIIVTSQSNRLGQVADMTYMLGRSRLRERSRSAGQQGQPEVNSLQAGRTNLVEQTA